MQPERCPRDDRWPQWVGVVAGMLPSRWPKWDEPYQKACSQHNRNCTTEITQQVWTRGENPRDAPHFCMPTLTVVRSRIQETAGTQEGCNSYCITCYLAKLKEIETNILMCCLSNGIIIYEVILNAQSIGRECMYRYLTYGVGFQPVELTLWILAKTNHKAD